MCTEEMRRLIRSVSPNALRPMILILILFALLPGVALAGPLLIGIAFDADWVLRAGLGFDATAVVLGGASWWFVRTSWGGSSAGPPIGESMATAVGAGLVGFGLLCGALTLWRLFRDSDG